MFAAALLAASACTLGADYHLAADGDDARDGLAPASAWRSLGRVPAADLRPGDRILLRGGDAFPGSLALSHGGDAARPVTVASWGGGRARIEVAAGSDGIRIAGVGGIVIRDLELVGGGSAVAGIALRATGGRRGSDIVIHDVAASGFAGRGIDLSADDAGSGFDRVLVERVDCSACGEAGMGSWGPCLPGAWAFHGVVVRDSVFHGNRGLPAKNDNHSGNGIILGDCADALIESCAAWDNGGLCAFPGGGPVGIWLCESDRSAIRGCASFANRTGAGSLDGGGFDLDGGCTGCVIEGCVSWANDGAGYLLCQYAGAREMRRNTVRECISLYDGRAHRYGAVSFFGAQSEAVVERCTFVIGKGSGENAGIIADSWGAAMPGCIVRDCVLVVRDGIPPVADRSQPGLRIERLTEALISPVPSWPLPPGLPVAVVAALRVAEGTGTAPRAAYGPSGWWR